MSSVGLEQLTRAVIESWNQADWASYRALTGPGFVYEEAGTGRRVTDLEDLLAGWRRLKCAFPDATAQITYIHADDDLTVACVIWRATQTGPLPTTTGPEPPSYKKVQVADLIAMRWQHHQVVFERHHLGFLSLMAPLLGGPGSRGLGRSVGLSTKIQ